MRAFCICATETQDRQAILRFDKIARYNSQYRFQFREERTGQVPVSFTMPNHKSAIKRMRQNEKRRQYNRTYRNRARTLVKKARVAISGGDVAAAEEAVRVASKDLDMAARRGVIHARNAARRKSRLMKQLAQLKAGS